MPLPVTNILMRDASNRPAFCLSIVGLTAADFLTVPNIYAQTLAARYPDFRPSILDIEDQPEDHLRPPSGGKRLTPRTMRV